jgi:PAS domain S-box-containing protein
MVISKENNLELLLELPVAIYTCDAKGVIQIYNKAAVELWGRAPKAGKDQWCGSWKIYRPDGTPLPLDRCPMAIILKGGKVSPDVEIIIERPDGSRRHVIPHPQPIVDLSGTITGAVNMLVDITDRRIAEENSYRLAAIVQSSSDAIISKTLDGIIKSWNPAAERLFGYKSEEMIGQHILKLIPPDRINEEPMIIERLKSGELVDHFETKRLTKDGELIDISLTISPVRDRKGKIIGA